MKLDCTLAKIAKKLLLTFIVLLIGNSRVWAYSYGSSVVTQISGTALPGAVNQHILTWRVNSTGSCCGGWTLNSLTFTLQNTNNAHITGVKLYWSTGSTFSTSNQRGSTITTIPGNNIVTFTFNESVTLLNTTNYYFLVYNISPTAPCDGASLLDAQATSLVHSTSTNVAINQNPAGAVTLSGPTSPPSISVTPAAVNTCSGTNVSFTATPGNAGTGPAYQWTLNGSNAGTNSTSFSTNALATGSQVQCTVTSGNVCASPRSVASNIPAVTVTNTPTAAITPDNPQTVCDGGTILLTAVTNASNPTYQWRLNGNPISGETNSTYTVTASGNYSVTVTENGSTTCSTTSASVSETFDTPTTPAVSIVASTNNICSGTNVTFTATPTNGGSNPTYQWIVNSSNAGTNSPTFNSSTLQNGDNISCFMTSNKPCASPPTANSNVITMVVTQTPSAAITPNNPQSVCNPPTASIDLTRVTNASNPTYQWKMNGSNIPGATDSVYSVTSSGNYSVVVTQNGSTTCSTESPSVSETITATVTPAISISVPSSTICAGSTTTFTASQTNGGSSPTYQWRLNGNPAGNNSPTYTPSSLNNGDEVFCRLISNATCANPSLVVSNTITIIVSPTPTASITPGFTQSVCSPATGTILTALSSATNSPSYQWKLDGTNIGGATAGTYNATVSGQYSVVVTDNGAAVCTSPVSSPVLVNVVASPQASASVTPATLCRGSSASLTSTGSTGSTFNFQVNNSQSIPDASFPPNSTGGRTQNVSVSGLPGDMSGVTISLTITANHYANNELEIYLIRPAGAVTNAVSGTNLITTIPGQSISISTDNGGTGANYTNAVFSDGAANSITTTGNVNITGNWRPEEAFNTFTGNPNGTWTIRVMDDAYSFGISGGNLVTWKLTFTLPNSVSYSWTSSPGNFTSPFQNPGTVSPTDSTDYTVTVTDNIFGCTKTATTHLNVVPRPSPKIIPGDSTVCAGQSYYLHVIDTGAYANGYPAGTTVDWVGLINGLTPADSFPVNGNGTHFQVRINLPGGLCPTLSPIRTVITKSISASPVVSKTNCGHDDGRIKIITTGGIAPFHFVWSHAGNVIRDTVSNLSVDSVYNLPVGTYCLEITDNYGNADPGVPSCNSGNICFNVVAQPALVLSFTNVQMVSCNGSADGSATIFATGETPPYSYSWLPSGGNTATADSLAPGIYYVTVTDANGCSKLDSAQITEPSPLLVSVSSDSVKCQGGNNGSATALVTGGTASYIYNWYDHNFQLVSQSSTATNLDAGLYYIYANDAHNCSVFDSVVVAEPSTPIDDNDLCTTDACDPSNGNISHTPVNTDDNNVCTADACDPSTGISHNPINIDDNNSCTVDACDPITGVSHTPVDVDDNDVCTTDACDPSTGNISHTPVNTDDGDGCTTDACDPITGVSHTPVDVDDNNVCTTDACDPSTGNISHTPVNTDDGDGCTNDGCDPITGVSHTPVDVDDNDVCTTDACDPSTGNISHTPVNTDDGDGCTTDACDPITGVSHTPVDVNDNDVCTTDACDPSTGNISHVPVNPDDNNACTSDACDPASGVSHVPVNTDDGNPCTIDGCDTITGVYHNPAEEVCYNGIDDDCDGFTDEGCIITLNVKLFMEGFYSGGSMQSVLLNAGAGTDPLIADSVVIALNSVVSPFEADTSIATLVDIHGNSSIELPSGHQNNSYYIVIKHRNLIETWSKDPVTLGTNTSYDFRITSGTLPRAGVINFLTPSLERKGKETFIRQ